MSRSSTEMSLLLRLPLTNPVHAPAVGDLRLVGRLHAEQLRVRVENPLRLRQVVAVETFDVLFEVLDQLLARHRLSVDRLRMQRVRIQQTRHHFLGLLQEKRSNVADMTSKGLSLCHLHSCVVFEKGAHSVAGIRQKEAGRRLEAVVQLLADRPQLLRLVIRGL